ncbi:MAG: hypothetical protein A2W01_00630 [Candidatus Solincola sediminis]|uniref:Uncharacterized protein n=1 Tax=Candidatus Solincola sediminis TaxID=1797199 RepID=A0A1F2WJ94_9ACTN|nr:MAG: hypothetical protein A2Y75_07105 [Candidatus Solincola sediminis]OFW60357.1 MAG: hypothetical protein A2W01_00630 [Candidatus Solincola sediminis]
MAGKKLCKVCGVPLRVTKEHEWLSNGTIVQRENREHRMVFIETENLAATFSGVEEIIGRSIERIIIEAKRRATFDFVDHMLPAAVKKILRVVGMRPAVKSISALGSVMGFGDIQLVRVHRAQLLLHDYVIMKIKEPYSIALFCGDVAGTFNAVNQREVAVTYKQESTVQYEVTGRISTHPLGLQDRLQAKVYADKEGDVKWQPCAECGGPMELSEYQWHVDRGIIESREHPRRMALVGPASLDAVIEELESELGDSIPQVVIEAQRRFIRTGFYTLEEIASEELFRKQLAIRGLGNVREVEWGEGSMRFRMENQCLHLVIVGLVLGFFELAFGREGVVQWEVTDGGDLVVEVALKEGS